MELSVIIVSYNTKKLLQQNITLLKHQLRENFSSAKEYEVIVVDNASSDSSQQWLKQQKNIQLIISVNNLGFGRANNLGLEKARGEYVLLLNSDVLLTEPIDFRELIVFLKHDPKRAALAINLRLPDGTMDPACHRGFPTPWNALFYFLGLEKLTAATPLAPFFGGYHLTGKDLTREHEIDCPSAAFFLVKRTVFQEAGGFDPDYFFYAEDIDLCYRIKQKGYSIWFYPSRAAQHLKWQSGKKHQDPRVVRRAQYHFISSMLLFYEKHYAKRYNPFVNFLVRVAVQTVISIKRLA